MIKTVDDYIAQAPLSVQAKLRQMRAIIGGVAPHATEKLSYQMPYYGYKGRLAYFTYTKEHVGLYIPPPVIADHKKELESYSTSTGTVRFPLNEKLPESLIKKLVLARVKINESSKKK